MAALVETRTQSPLDINRGLAITGLRRYLASPGERARHEVPGREHQADSMDKFLAFLESGETAGYFNLPTGSGKTVVTAGIIKATGLHTIITSPTGTISDKTKATIESIATGVKVSNYDGRSKSLAGNVINTTPNSLDQLAAIPALAEGTQLLIVDENDVGTLSEQRHKLWRQFPNALIVGLTATPDFSQLQSLIRKGLVDPNERWVGAFSKKIAEMSREEAMARGALAPLDIHMFRTLQTVGEVDVSAKGRYNEKQIDRYLNTEARNMLVVALVAGLDRLPDHVTLPPDLAEDIRETHEKIKGKRTVIFGLNINHIEDLAARLQAVDVKAAAVSGKMSKANQDIIDQAHQAGRLPVVLTDELFRRGWDSPATEVGLFADITQSGVALSQGLGRIQRLSPETGKDRAIAIQLVDTTETGSDRPVYLPQLFDPEAVLASTKGEVNISGEDTARREKKVRAEKPMLTITGMKIDTLIEEITSEEVLNRKFDVETVEDINNFFDQAVEDLRAESADRSLVSYYKTIAEMLPVRMAHEKQQMVLDAARNGDDQARRAFILMNIRSILSIVSSHFNGNYVHNEDIIHSAIETIYTNMDAIDTERNIGFQLRGMLARGDFPTGVGLDEDIPPTWVRDGKDGRILKEIDRSVAEQDGLNDGEVASLAQELSDTTGYKAETLAEVINVRNSGFVDEEDDPRDSTTEIVFEMAKAGPIAAVLDTLTEREAEVIRLRFGLADDGQPRTLDEIGAVLGVTRERVRQIESKTMGKLRHPQRTKALRGLLN